MDLSDKTRKEFIETYDEMADKLFRYCFFKVSDREKAKDLVQETFFKTWDYLSSGKEIQNLKSFLYRVANNLIIDYYRKIKDSSLDSLREKGFDISSDGKEEIFSKTEHTLALKALEDLDEKYREIIIFRFVDGLLPKDISEITGLSENVISVRLNRALKKLREIIKTDLK